jgi:hypothetical protein
MNANTTLEKIRALAQSKMVQLQPLAGEEMSLPSFDPHRDGFVDGERTLAAQILGLLDGTDTVCGDLAHTDPIEDEMVMDLGRT